MNKKLIAFLLLSSISTYAGPLGCQLDPSTDAMVVGPNAALIKLFHVTGKHQCQSSQNIGYYCDVETRDATDCTSGHGRLRNQNCCGYFNGQQQSGGRSIGYTPKACSPVW